MSRSQIEGTAFISDDNNLPPYMQLHFSSMMYEPEFAALFIDLLNFDPKVFIRITVLTSIHVIYKQSIFNIQTFHLEKIKK